MKDFPLNELLAATDLAKVQESLLLIFGHINKKLRLSCVLPSSLLHPTTNLPSLLSPYPIRRALPLVEAISRDLNEQLLKVLGSQRLTYLEFPAFERAMLASSAVFSAWDDSLKEFTNVAREVTRKRSEKFLPIKINPAHAALQERVTYLRGFRKQHHELQVMVGPLGTDTKRIGDGREVERVSVLNDIDMDAEVSFCR